MTSGPDKPPEISQMFMQMADLWRKGLEQAATAGKTWSESMLPFLTTRAAENSLFGAAQGGEISEAIKRMVEGPRLADVWDLDRQMMAVTAAWMDIRQRMATYQAVASIPWNRALERYGAGLAEDDGKGKDGNWRKAFAAWSAIANEELISNQRSPEFLSAQRELLRSALELRSHQQKFADSVAKLFGFPTQKDFDELSRQLTELRRELRTHVRAQRKAAVAVSDPATAATPIQAATTEAAKVEATRTESAPAKRSPAPRTKAAAARRSSARTP